jgi:hypothetical protein
MNDQFEGGCLCGSTLCGHWSAEMGWRGAIAKVAASTAVRPSLCSRHSSVPSIQLPRRDNQGQLVAGDAARILRQVRVNIDLRKRASASRNAFPCRRIRRGRAISADEAHIPGAAIAVAIARPRQFVIGDSVCFRRAGKPCSAAALIGAAAVPLPCRPSRGRGCCPRC